MHVAASSPSRAFRFGPFTVDFRLGELRKHGARVRLQEQPLQVLAMLLERPGDLVTREELRQRLWPADTFVDFDHGLNAAINRLRERLGDNAEKPRYIETIPRRGYRFLAPVEAISQPDRTAPVVVELPSPAGDSVRRRWPHAVAATFLLALVGMAAWLSLGLRGRAPAEARPIHSIAVLPLNNFSGTADQEYFSDGLTDELITQLAKIRSLRVISHTSVVRYKGTSKPLPEIARELNVDAIVEGSVVRTATHVRVSAQLVDGRSDRHLWAESYERSLAEVTTLQTEVARDIATSIHAAMGPEGPAPSSARNASPGAYEAYLRGRSHLMARRTPDAMLKSIGSFQEAIHLDPAFPLAYAGLADALISASYLGVVPARDAMVQARAAVLKALELDPSEGEARAALGVIYFTYDWDWDAGGRELQLALQQAPNYALGHHYYANYLAAVGRHEEALAEIERAHDLDPFSFWITRDVGRLNYFAHRYEQALAALHAAVALEPDSGRAAYNWQSWVYEELGRKDEAVKADLKFLELGGWPSALLADAEQTYRSGGWQAYWRKRLQLLARHPDLLIREAKFPPQLAVAYARAGQNDAAFALLRRGCEEHSVWLAWIAVNPSYDRLRADARFKGLLHCIGADKLQVAAMPQTGALTR